MSIELRHGVGSRLRRLSLAVVAAISATSACGGAEQDEKACRSRESLFERTICADQSAKAEDARMSATYFETMHRLDETRKRELLADQRRWLKRQFAERFTDDADMYTTTDNIITAISQRTLAIITRFHIDGYNGAPDLFHAEGRHAPVYDPGKPFQGTYPGFQRWRGSEQELPEMYFQQGARVCGIRSEWFSGHIAVIGIVATAKGETASVRLTCRMDHTGERCATDEDDKLLWLKTYNMTMKRCGQWVVGDEQSECSAASVPQLGFSDEDIRYRPTWIAKCLGDANFPSPAQVSDPG